MISQIDHTHSEMREIFFFRNHDINSKGEINKNDLKSSYITGKKIMNGKLSSSHFGHFPYIWYLLGETGRELREGEATHFFFSQ